MIKEGREIKDNIRCWCGGLGYFSHFSSMTRKDGKKTVIYVCSHNHRIFEEINDANKRIGKEIKTKSKVKSKKPKAPNKGTETDTNK